MKRIFTPLQIAFVGLIAICATSCQHEKLNEVVKEQSFATVKATLPARIDVAQGSTYTLTGAELTVPATINFSSATSSAFTIDLATNTDTVASLVNSGVLAPGTVAFATGAAAVTPQITIPAGVTSFSFNVVISRSALELGFGKTLAAVIKATTPTKGNKIDNAKAAMIVTVKTADVITAESIHDISFGVTNKIVNLAGSTYYSLGSLYLTVSIPVVLNGEPGSEFNVNVASVQDSVTNGIASGLLPNSVLYPDSKISVVTPTVTIQNGTNTALLTVNLKINDLLAQQPAPATPSVKSPTIALTLTSSSKYQITTTKIRTVYVVIEPNYFRPYYGTPFLIKGTVGAVSDPIYCAYYDFGGEGVAYHDDNSKSGDGGWRTPDYVDVNPDYTPRSVVGWTSSGEWLSYSVNVEQTGTYQLNTVIGGNSQNRTYSVFVDGVRYNQTPYPVTYTTNYNNQGPNYTTIQLTKGYHIIKLYWDNADYDVRGMIFTRLAN
ncbi:hypothetical protein [Mucilaginibacter panaciglaebae]|uniref:Carbohydrate binding protein with CBM6 domain n=1 Tax=Mucilaginibacter panaciglaebae TaxID=502331 RepID=A0ABP7X677_9SPHI